MTLSYPSIPSLFEFDFIQVPGIEENNSYSNSVCSVTSGSPHSQEGNLDTEVCGLYSMTQPLTAFAKFISYF